MSQKFHMCLSVSGGLKNIKSFKGGVIDENGKPLTREEFRIELLEHEALGHKVIPLCECDNFDYEHGCLGHEKTENPE